MGERDIHVVEFLRKKDWTAIHRDSRFRYYTPLLAFFSFLYGIAQRLRYSGYNLRILKKRALPGLVVSVGNLTTGGTGKTPAVVALAKWAISQKIRVCIISRGYGGRYKDPVLVVSNGRKTLTDSYLAGDEPMLLAEKVPESPVVLSRKRYLAGKYAREKFGSELFIMDDGFQHMQLERDLNLVLLDGTQPFGNGHLLPRGPLREPLGQLARADAIVLTRFRRAGGRGTMAFLKENYPQMPVFCADHVPDEVIFPRLGRVDSPGVLNGKRVVAFAGIGAPESFRETLVSLGAEVVAFSGFKDHYEYRKDDLEHLVRLKTEEKAHFVLTTEKDWVKMGPIWPECSEIAVLSIQFSFLPGQEGVFRMVENALGKK